MGLYRPRHGAVATGRIDLLVNNAGIGMRTVNPRFMTDPQGFWQVPVDRFRAVIETNRVRLLGSDEQVRPG